MFLSNILLYVVLILRVSGIAASAESISDASSTSLYMENINRTQEECKYIRENEIFYECIEFDVQKCLTCDQRGLCVDKPNSPGEYHYTCDASCIDYLGRGIKMSCGEKLTDEFYLYTVCHGIMIVECTCGPLSPCKLDFFNSNAIRNCSDLNNPYSVICLPGQVPDLEICECVDVEITTSTVETDSTTDSPIQSTTPTNNPEISPEDECEYDGDQVCYSCTSFAECSDNFSGGYDINVKGICTVGYSCVNVASPPGTECQATEESSACFCDDNVQCMIDPFNSQVFVNCSQGYAITEACEEGQKPDLQKCMCE